MVHPTASVKSHNINSFQVLWLGSNPFIRMNNYEMQRTHNHAFKPFHLDWKAYFSISSNHEKKTAPKNRRIHEQIPCGPKRSTGWRVQPIWKTWLSNWIISANRGENKKSLKPPPRKHQAVPSWRPRLPETSHLHHRRTADHKEYWWCLLHQMQLLETPPSCFVGRLMNKAHYKFS